MRSRPFAHAHLRNPREIRVTKAGNQLEITAKAGNQLEITEISYAEKARVVPLGASVSNIDSAVDGTAYVLCAEPFILWLPRLQMYLYPRSRTNQSAAPNDISSNRRKYQHVSTNNGLPGISPW